VAALCEELAEAGGSRPVLTGFSQGGILTFAVAASRPELVTAAVPIAGWLPPALVPGALPPGAAAVPIRAFHGGADDRLPAGPTRELVERLRSLGFDAELRVYPGVPHAISAEMRRDYFRFLSEALSARRRRDAASTAAPTAASASWPGSGTAATRNPTSSPSSVGSSLSAIPAET
jgi:phospholipase/carboxylesterase